MSQGLAFRGGFGFGVKGNPWMFKLGLVHLSLASRIHRGPACKWKRAFSPNKGVRSVPDKVFRDLGFRIREEGCGPHTIIMQALRLPTTMMVMRSATTWTEAQNNESEKPTTGSCSSFSSPCIA